MKLKPKQCSMCKHASFIDDTSATMRCGKYGTLENQNSIKLCFDALHPHIHYTKKQLQQIAHEQKQKIIEQRSKHLEKQQLTFF